MDAKREDLAEQGKKYFFAQQLAGAADGGVPGQLLVQVVLEEKADIEAVAAVLDQAPVGGDVVEVADENDLEEYYRVDALLSFGAVVGLCLLVEKAQIECGIEPAVEVLFWHQLIQMQLVEGLW